MATLLVKNADVLVTMAGEEIAGGGLLARDGWIEEVGPTDQLPGDADEVVDLGGHVVFPGLVNTHHHLYQTLTRAFPGAQDVGLFEWLTTLYPVWGKLTPDHVETATTLGLAELALTGCTTASDHQYLWPGGSSIDDQVRGARPVGIRFHVSRGSMSLGESDGGLPPDELVEDEDAILEDCRRAVEDHHDPSPGSRLRVALSPCSPFSVTSDLMRQSAALARELGVGLHTHVAETADEESYCLDRFGARPVPHVTDLGWAGPDVSYAHAVHVSPDEVAGMASAGTGVAHCPTSNMRLSSGIAPVAAYAAAGVAVGLGVDGSASNDSSAMLAEARQAMLVSRLAAAPGWGDGPLMSVRTALELATVGGAAVLGRDDIGRLSAGRAADFVAVDLNRVELAGAVHDPVAALVLCGIGRIDHSWVGGVRVVDHRRLVGLEEEALVERHNRLATALRE
jgi:8-oxoguanine deaminase